MANLEGSIQIWSQTAAQWTADNPTLLAGQPAHESDTNKFKVGDGVTAWNALAYIGGAGGGTVDSVSGTSNRIVITGTAADPIVNIASAYDDAITAEIAAAVAGINTVVMRHAPNNQFSPADGQHYYFGMQSLAASNTAGNTQTNLRELAAPATGTIIAAVITLRLDNGATVSSETSTLYLRNTTQATLPVITNSFTYVATGSPSYKAVVVTGLNIAITAGDLCMSVIGNPTFATNPSTCYFNIDYIIQTP
jgi:hypothetical protein